jgi:hypothetical protein
LFGQLLLKLFNNSFIFAIMVVRAHKHSIICWRADGPRRSVPERQRGRYTWESESRDYIRDSKPIALGMVEAAADIIAEHFDLRFGNGLPIAAVGRGL